MGLSTPSLNGYLTVTEAAKSLGVQPWDVMRLVESGAVESVILIDSGSLPAAKEPQ